MQPVDDFLCIYIDYNKNCYNNYIGTYKAALTQKNKYNESKKKLANKRSVFVNYVLIIQTIPRKDQVVCLSNIRDIISGEHDIN